MKIHRIIQIMKTSSLKLKEITGRLAFFILFFLFLTSCSLNTTEPITPTNTSTPMKGCLSGSWQIKDLSEFVNSFNALNVTDSKISMVDQNQRGNLQFTFSPENTVKVKAEKFVQTYSVKTVVGGVAHEIPVKIRLDGEMSAKYELIDQQITFHNQTNDGFTFYIETFGISESLNNEILGAAGIDKTYQVHCYNNGTMTLQVTAEGVDLAPISLERLP